MGVPHVREKKRGERCCALLGLLGGLAGPRARAGFGSVSFFFFLLFFSVSVFFLSFAIWLQSDSNNFVNFSKIQSIKVGQSKTGFHNKIRFSIKPYNFSKRTFLHNAK
jgi:hypothetical protein